MFLLGLVCLVTLGPEDGYGAPVEPQISKGGTVCDDNFCLKKSRDGATWHLVYGFKGLHDQWHEVVCDITEADSKRLHDSFGYLDSDRKASWLKNLEEAINVAAGLYPNDFEYGKAHVTKEAVEWRPVEELPPGFGRQVFENERKKFFAWYKVKSTELIEHANKKFLMKHKFMILPGLGEVPDYSAVVSSSSQALRSCAEAFKRETGGQAELLQAFFQSMVYEKIHMEEGGRKTGGLSLPVRVMVEGKGDCDSKAVAFCAIRRKNDIILRSLPGQGSLQHALVGVAAWEKDSHPKEIWPHKPVPEALKAMLYGDPIRIGLRDYWPCEVAGRDRIAFGRVKDGHEGRYVAIRTQ